MLVLVSRYTREPSEFIYFTTKSKSTTSSYSLKQAKKFKSVEAIDKYFELLSIPEEFKDNRSWRNNWTSREVDNVTSLTLDEFKPVGNFVLRDRDGNFYGGSNLYTAKQYTAIDKIDLANWEKSYEIKHCFYGTKGLVLSSPNKVFVSFDNHPKTTDVVLGGQRKPIKGDMVLGSK